MNLEILPQILLAVGLISSMVLMIFAYKRFEHKNLNQKRVNYYFALNILEQNPNNPYIKQECMRLGDIYYSDMIPDIYSYPLPNYGLYVESIDNSEKRRELIEKDMNALVEKHFQQAA